LFTNHKILLATRMVFNSHGVSPGICS